MMKDTFGIKYISPLQGCTRIWFTFEGLTPFVDVLRPFRAKHIARLLLNNTGKSLAETERKLLLIH